MVIEATNTWGVSEVGDEGHPFIQPDEVSRDLLTRLWSDPFATYLVGGWVEPTHLKKYAHPSNWMMISPKVWGEKIKHVDETTN